MNSNSDDSPNSDENKNHKMVLKNLDTDITNLENEYEILKNRKKLKKKNIKVTKESDSTNEDEISIPKKPLRKKNTKKLLKNIKKKGMKSNGDLNLLQKKKISKTYSERRIVEKQSVIGLFDKQTGSPNVTSIPSQKTNNRTSSGSPVEEEETFGEAMIDEIIFNDPKPVSERIKIKAYKHREKTSGEAMLFLSYLTDENVKKNFTKMMNFAPPETSKPNEKPKEENSRKFIEEKFENVEKKQSPSTSPQLPIKKTPVSLKPQLNSANRTLSVRFDEVPKQE